MLHAGTRVGGYEITGLLGTGGMGEVYRARDCQLGRDVAVKLLSRTFAENSDSVARFAREARALASLNHPNIAQIYAFEAGSTSADPGFLVMELVEGEDLSARIARGPIPVADALSIARQVAEALEAAHGAGILHRDLKPSNIRVRADGASKVLDFGLSSARDQSSVSAEAEEARTVTGRALTQAGIILGTAAYMSPEQAKGLVVDRRADIWAFGCVLFEMLSAKRCFNAGSVAEVLASVLAREPDWTALPQPIPRHVRRVLARCLQKDPKRRYHDIADARIDLEEVSGSASGISSAIEQQRSTAPLPSALRVHAMWGIVGALLVSGVWWSLMSRLTPTVERTPAVTISVLPPRGTSFATGAGGPWPTVSPDGRHIVFSALTAAGQQLWVRSLDSATPRPLDDTEGAIRPFWSPDSQSIAFFANGQLRRISFAGGTARVICDAPYSGGLAGTWGDGTIVFNAQGGLRRVSAGGGTPTILKAVAPDLEFAVPNFLPDARHFLYLEHRGNVSPWRACVGSVDTAEATCLFDTGSPVIYTPPDRLLFVRNGLLQTQTFDTQAVRVSGEPVTIADDPIEIAYPWQPPSFSTSTNGTLAYYTGGEGGPLAWLDRAGKRLETLSLNAGGPVLSPDETQVLLHRRDVRMGTNDLWLYDRTRGTESRITFGPSNENNPAFFPDGSRVLFVAERAGRTLLFQKLLASGQESSVGGLEGAMPDVSSDGRFVAYQALAPRTGFDLWAAPLSGGGKPFVVINTEHGEREPSFSPDVRWIAYDSTESGRRDVWVQPFPPSGARWQISTGGGVSPHWRGDGKELFYVAADGTLMAIPVTPSTSGATFVWNAPKPLFRTIFRGGTYASFAVSRDGQRFLMNVPPTTDEASPIVILVNWPSALRR